MKKDNSTVFWAVGIIGLCVILALVLGAVQARKTRSSFREAYPFEEYQSEKRRPEQAINPPGDDGALGAKGDLIDAALANRDIELERKSFAGHLRSSKAYEPHLFVKVFSENEVRADAELKGRWSKVRGAVEKVGKDIRGKPYVTFRRQEGSWRSVQCFFSDANELLDVDRGDVLTIYGIVGGLSGNVILKQCSLDPNEFVKVVIY